MVSLKEAWISFILRYFIVIILISIGGLIFMELENVHVKDEAAKIRLKRTQNIKKKEDIRQQLSTTLNATVNATLFDAMVQDLMKLKEMEIPNKWNFETGGTFAFTIVSTVGYGVVVPKYDATKIVCMIFAILGIPIYMYALAAAGAFKKVSIEKLLYLIEIKIMKKDEIKALHKKTMIFTIILFFVEMFVVSASILQIEKTWSFLECFYFWFITASTIGFGDYVMGFEGNNRFSVGLQIFSILASLVLQSGLATILATAQEMIEKRAERGEKCGCFRLKSKDSNSNQVSNELQNIEKVSA